MSRHAPNRIGRRSWRAAVVSLLIAAGTTIGAALFIAARGQAADASLTLFQLDSGWLIRSGGVEANQLVLRPAARSIGVALHPIDSSTFTVQARLAPADGAAGLIVQADDADHFSAFLISSDGYFRVSDYRNGIWIDRAAWREWPHIQRGSSNMLRAECQAAECNFFVNDEWTWREPGLPAARAIGVVADAQTTRKPFEARFDQIGWHP